MELKIDVFYIQTSMAARRDLLLDQTTVGTQVSRSLDEHVRSGPFKRPIPTAGQIKGTTTIVETLMVKLEPGVTPLTLM